MHLKAIFQVRLRPLAPLAEISRNPAFSSVCEWIIHRRRNFPLLFTFFRSVRHSIASFFSFFLFCCCWEEGASNKCRRNCAVNLSPDILCACGGSGGGISKGLCAKLFNAQKVPYFRIQYNITWFCILNEDFPTWDSVLKTESRTNFQAFPFFLTGGWFTQPFLRMGIFSKWSHLRRRRRGHSGERTKNVLCLVSGQFLNPACLPAGDRRGHISRHHHSHSAGSLGMPRRRKKPVIGK